MMMKLEDGIVNALIRASERGVRVYFLLDAYGGNSFSKELIKMVEDAGILFRLFSPQLLQMASSSVCGFIIRYCSPMAILH